jgi:hypothetical protein
MLRYSLVLVAGFWVAGSAGAASWANALFDELSKDFGSVPRGPTLSHHFRVVNRTKHDVNISNVKVACGCVRATALKMTLKPGEETTIYVTMDTTRFTGPKSVTVFVTFDAPQFDEVRLYVQANGRNDFAVTPDTLAFGQVKRGTAVNATVTVTIYGHNDAKITIAKGESNYIQPAIVEKRRTEHEVVYEVTTKLRNDTPVGKWYTDVWLETNVTTLPKIRVPLTVEIESPLTISPGNVALGNIKNGEDLQRRVIVRGVKPFKIAAIVGGDSTVAVSTPSTEAREVHVLTITLKSDKPGTIDRTLRVVTDLKEDNTLDFNVSASILP